MVKKKEKISEDMIWRAVYDLFNIYGKRLQNQHFTTFKGKVVSVSFLQQESL